MNMQNYGHRQERPSALILGAAQLGTAIVSAVEEQLIEQASVERIRVVLGYLDAADPLGDEPGDNERRALDLITNLPFEDANDLILVRVRWISELAVLYSIATDHHGHTPGSNGLAKLRHKVEAASR